VADAASISMETAEVCCSWYGSAQDKTNICLGFFTVAVAFAPKVFRAPPLLMEILLCLCATSPVLQAAWFAESEVELLQFVLYGGFVFPLGALLIGGARFVPSSTSVAIMVIFVLVRCAFEGWLLNPLVFLCKLSIHIFACMWCLCALQKQRADIMNTQHEVAAEKEASEALLSMICDATCWVAADGGRILRSDGRLDEAMGSNLGGRPFEGYIADGEDLERLRAVLTSPGTEGPRPPATLLPTTLRAPHSTRIDVDLFIVDRRLELSCGGRPSSASSVETDRLGFLIGIRFTNSAQAAEAASAMFEGDAGQESVIGRAGSSVASPGRCSHDVESALSRVPSTLQSAQLARPVMHRCNLEAMEALLSQGELRCGFPQISDPEARATVLLAVDLVCRHALGGAMVVIATEKAFCQTFHQELRDGEVVGPAIRVSDGGYMTQRLRNTRVTDERFADAFREFTLHSDNDRWPDDHTDPGARGQPKDGAFLLSTRGYRVKCAAKLLGLPPAGKWESVGTKHEAALACAAAVAGSVVLVRSDSGSVHLVQKLDGVMHVYALECRNCERLRL